MKKEEIEILERKWKKNNVSRHSQQDRLRILTRDERAQRIKSFTVKNNKYLKKGKDIRQSDMFGLLIRKHKSISMPD